MHFKGCDYRTSQAILRLARSRQAPSLVHASSAYQQNSEKRIQLNNSTRPPSPTESPSLHARRVALLYYTMTCLWHATLAYHIQPTNRFQQIKQTRRDEKA